MPESSLSVQEIERLAALRGLQLLDTAPEERFDRITRTAQRLFGVPVVLISLLDRNRQWFKSSQGWNYGDLQRPLVFRRRSARSGSQHLDRDGPVKLRIVAEIDRAEPARPEDPLHLVSAEGRRRRRQALL